MEHPFIHDIDHLSLEELGSKVNELQKKLSIAHRIGNGYLCDQIRMALTSYQTKYSEKLNASFSPKPGSDDPDFNNKIDIS